MLHGNWMGPSSFNDEYGSFTTLQTRYKESRTQGQGGREATGC